MVFAGADLCERIWEDHIGDITDMAVFELAFAHLKAEISSFLTHNPANAQTFITQLLRRVQEVLLSFPENSHLLPHFELRFQITDNR